MRFHLVLLLALWHVVLPARADRRVDSQTTANDAQQAADFQRQQAQAARNLANQLEEKAKKDDQVCSS